MPIRFAHAMAQKIGYSNHHKTINIAPLVLPCSESKVPIDAKPKVARSRLPEYRDVCVFISPLLLLALEIWGMGTYEDRSPLG